MLDGRNIQLGKSVGTKIGTAVDQLLGLFGVTPVSQGSAISSPSVTSVSGSGDDATINTNFSNLKTSVDSLRTSLSDIGINAS